MYVAGKEIDGAAIRRAAFQLFISLTISITHCVLERERRFELPTLALARRCSTTELFPLIAADTFR